METAALMSDAPSIGGHPQPCWNGVLTQPTNTEGEPMKQDDSADGLLFALQGAAIAFAITHPDKKKLAAALHVEQEALMAYLLAKSPTDAAVDSCRYFFESLLEKLADSERSETTRSDP